MAKVMVTVMARVMVTMVRVVGVVVPVPMMVNPYFSMTTISTGVRLTKRRRSSARSMTRYDRVSLSQARSVVRQGSWTLTN